MSEAFDIVIVGGGLVGAALACALDATGARIGLLEARSLEVPTAGEAGADAGADNDRAIALAEGSRRIFEGLGLWRYLQGRVAPIRHIHVSERGGFGFSRMDAEDEALPALGYVAEARVLDRGLRAALANLTNVQCVAPARLTGVRMHADRVEVRYRVGEETRSLHTRLLVAADGIHSSVRRFLGISSHDKDYGQTAVVANAALSRSHQGWAYERFTDFGPLAVLPLAAGPAGKNRCAVVWTVNGADADALLEAPDTEFLERLQERFGWRLGRFLATGPRQAYPLHLVQSVETVRPRLAVVGNAAHTLHPIGGQGFNLGLRDVATLAEVLTPVLAGGGDPGHIRLLERYQAIRDRDMTTVRRFTDGLARLYGHRNPLSKLGRNLGLLALDRMPAAKRLLIRHAAGVAGSVPALASGWTARAG